MNHVYTAASTDPYENLAVEEYLLDTADVPTLYLWQNDRTVVVGRHQNAWAECDLAYLESFEGRLARRLSGGGAVYHDLGNLNFTFVMPRALYDQARQTAVLLDAVKRCGISAQMSGRNDLTADGRKFSGHAFCMRPQTAYHHGTLLLDTDLERMTRVLTVDASKLQSNAVASVRARVVNLRELNPALTVPVLAEAVLDAFIREYGPCEPITVPDVSKLREKYASWDWRCGETPKFDAAFKTRFPWGGLEVLLTLRDAYVTDVRVFSDALDETLAQTLTQELTGLPYRPDAIRQAVTREDIAAWLSGEITPTVTPETSS